MRFHYWKTDLYKTLCCEKDIVEVCSEIYAYSTNSKVLHFDKETDPMSDQEIFKFTTTISLAINAEVFVALRALDGSGFRKDSENRQELIDRVMLTTVSAIFMQSLILERSLQEYPPNEKLVECALQTRETIREGTRQFTKILQSTYLLADYYKLYTVSKLLQKNEKTLKQSDDFKFVYKKHKCLEKNPVSIDKRRQLIQSKVNALREETWVVGKTTIFEETAWLKKKYE